MTLVWARISIDYILCFLAAGKFFFLGPKIAPKKTYWSHTRPIQEFNS